MVQKSISNFDDQDFQYDLSDFFVVKEDQMKEILKRADHEYLEGRFYTFYEYEEYYNSRDYSKMGIDRDALLYAFRYAYIAGVFPKEFWVKLLQKMDHPIEANLVTREFQIKELTFNFHA